MMGLCGLVLYIKRNAENTKSLFAVILGLEKLGSGDRDR